MSNVGWPHLLPLTLRLQSAKTLLQFGQSLPVLLADSQVEHVIARTDALSASEGPMDDVEYRRGDDGYKGTVAPLEAYLGEVAGGLSAKASAYTSDTAKAVVAALTSAFNRQVCHSCARGDAPICVWSAESHEEDALTVDSAGHCVAAIKEIFDFCDLTARMAYQAATGTAPSKSLVLSTGHTTSANNTLGIAVHGITKSVSDGLREVRLSFDIASFGIYDYLSLLYVAFHECFVHGYCGVQIVGGESGLSKPFHEGWMDCVAVLVLEQRLTRLISISTHHVEAYPDEFMKQARVVCDRRYNPVNKARLADVVDWNYGASALRTLQWLMAWHFIEQGVCDSVAVGPAVASELVRFSAVINASNLSHARRAEFVNIVASRYSYNNNAGRTDAISRRPEIIDALDAYFRTKNCLAFVEEVVAIPGS